MEYKDEQILPCNVNGLDNVAMKRENSSCITQIRKITFYCRQYFLFYFYEEIDFLLSFQWK